MYISIYTLLTILASNIEKCEHFIESSLPSPQLAESMLGEIPQWFLSANQQVTMESHHFGY